MGTADVDHRYDILDNSLENFLRSNHEQVYGVEGHFYADCSTRKTDLVRNFPETGVPNVSDDVGQGLALDRRSLSGIFGYCTGEVLGRVGLGALTVSNLECDIYGD